MLFDVRNDRFCDLPNRLVEFDFSRISPFESAHELVEFRLVVSHLSLLVPIFDSSGLDAPNSQDATDEPPAAQPKCGVILLT